MKKLIFITLMTVGISIFPGCGRGGETAAQSRTDLTADHIRGLSADMKRKDVEDLLGQDDDHLSTKEDLDVYSLSDGTTAVLRYVDDVLTGAYIRGKDMFEEPLFNKFDRNFENRLDDSHYNTENGTRESDSGTHQSDFPDLGDTIRESESK